MSIENASREYNQSVVAKARIHDIDMIEDRGGRTSLVLVAHRKGDQLTRQDFERLVKLADRGLSLVLTTEELEGRIHAAREHFPDGQDSRRYTAEDAITNHDEDRALAEEMAGSATLTGRLIRIANIAAGNSMRLEMVHDRVNGPGPKPGAEPKRRDPGSIVEALSLLEATVQCSDHLLNAILEKL